MASFTGSDGKTYRYSDYSQPDQIVHCYDSECQDQGKPMVDKVCRWEHVPDVMGGKPPSACLYTCEDHQPGFEHAKKIWGETQKTNSAVYMTKVEMARL